MSWLDFYNENADHLAGEWAKSIDLPALQVFAEALPTGASVLDAGCGPGSEMRVLREAGFVTEGIDQSARMVELTREKGLEARRGDLRLMTPPKASYDGVWCHRVLQHFSIEEIQRVLTLFFQSLRPETGLLFISFPDAPNPQILQSIDRHSGLGYRRHANEAIMGTIHQFGFEPIQAGLQDVEDETWFAILARRL